MPPEKASVPAKCLHCEAERTSALVCEGCHSLYPLPHSADYFDLLSVPKLYAIDESTLSTAFRAIARSVHPDRFGGEREEVHRLATRLSAEINQAFNVLKDPVRRADYMLELAGGPGAAELREVPEGLLAEVMMLREQIDEAKAAQDAPAIDAQRAGIAERREATLQKIAEFADGLDASTDDQKKGMRRLINSVKYYDNLLKELAADPLAEPSRTTNA
jgi:molecular chaperone HscB